MNKINFNEIRQQKEPGDCIKKHKKIWRLKKKPKKGNIFIGSNNKKYMAKLWQIFANKSCELQKNGGDDNSPMKPDYSD